MYKKNTLTTIAVVLMTVSVLLIVIPVQPAKAQFVIAWDYDSEKGNFDYDQYGQGFYWYNVKTNNTISGEWGSHPDYPGLRYFNESSYSFLWTVGYTMGIQFAVWMNSSLTGASDLTEGKGLIRVNATLTRSGGEIVDAQTNIESHYSTAFYSTEMWYYSYEAHFNAIAEEGVIYIATLTYEAYW